MDNINLLTGRKSYPEIMENVVPFLNNIKNWFSKKQLIMNESKMEKILFTTGPTMILFAKIDINNSSVPQPKSIKFLNTSMNWWNSQSNQASKLSLISDGISTTITNIYDTRIIYLSTFELVARYRIIFWGGTSKIYLPSKKLQSD